MSKRGRRRRNGQRTPSGQLSRAKGAIIQRGERDTVLAQPHRAWAPQDDRHGQNLECELGRLFEAGHLGPKVDSDGNLDVGTFRLWAGQRWRAIMRAYSIELASPVRPQSSGASMVASGVETPADAEHLAPLLNVETEEERKHRILAQYDDGAAVLGSGWSFRAVTRLCWDDQPLDEQDLQWALMGLDALVERWGFAAGAGPRRIRRWVA